MNSTEAQVFEMLQALIKDKNDKIAALEYLLESANATIKELRTENRRLRNSLDRIVEG